MSNAKANHGAALVSPREQRRLSQQDLGRNQLLDAAEEVFGRRGFHDASIKEIAELAEFSVGSVYSFFANKDDLFRQLFARRGDEYMPQMRQLLAGPGGARDLLHRLVDFEIGYFRQHRMFARLYLRFSSPALQLGDRLVDELVIGNFDEAMQLQTDLFAAGQQTNEFCPGTPSVLARLLSGLVAAFQAVDQSVMSDDPAALEHMSDEEFHSLVDRTFGAADSGASIGSTFAVWRSSADRPTGKVINRRRPG